MKCSAGQSRACVHCAVESLERRRILAGSTSIVIPPIVPRHETASTIGHLQGSLGSFTSVGSVGVSTQPRVPISFSRGSYQLNGVGIGIGGNADQFTYASRLASGDGSIVIRVASLTNTAAGAKAGVMFRSSLSPSAAFAGVFLTPSSGVTFMRRLSEGSASSQSILPGPTAPRFLKLTREVNSISAFQSADAVTWTQVGSTTTVALGVGPLVGLAATSGSNSLATTATFTHVNVLLPPGSEANDIGSPTAGGYASYTTTKNVYSIAGAGVDSAGAVDQLGFFHRPMLGSGSILASVDRFVTSPSASSAGVMIRSALAAGSPFAGVSLTAAGSIRFQWRTVSNGGVSTTTQPGATAPMSVKLLRKGDLISAFWSSDRVTWTQIGSSQSIAFSSARGLAGLSVQSGSSGTLATVELSGVSQLGIDGNSFDVGQASTGGSVLHDPASNAYTLLARGSGLAVELDQLSVAGQTMTGDGDVVAHLSGFAPSNASSRAGIVLRASASADAGFAGLFLTSTGLAFQSRASNGAGLQSANLPGITGPVSLKLSRIGGVVSARYSLDGINWLSAGPGVSVALGVSVIAAMAGASGGQTTFTTATFSSFASGTNLPPGAGVFSAADELFLNDLEARSTLFYWNETNASTGLVPDGSSAAGGNPSSGSSIAAVGFGLSALVLADDRGYLSHADAYTRALNTINFLYTNAAQVNGFYYHFLNPTTGARVGTTELSPMDTALLMAGVLDAAAHWSGTALATTAASMFDRVNWPWMQKPNGQFYGHWTPENGFEYGYGDFSEAVLLYLLGLGSKTHPVAASSWNAWSRSPVITYDGSTFITAQTRALFTVQYPQAWFDLRGKVDSFGLNYFENAKRATLAQRQLAINLAPTYPHYGVNVWGLTAADGPTGYTVWGGPPATANVDGSVVPTAPGGSLAFTPRQSIDALRTMQQTYGANVYRKYGFVDAFNPGTSWTSSIVLGIDVGMMLLAAENARSGDVWERFMQTTVAQTALTRAFGAARITEPSVAVEEPSPAAVQTRQTRWPSTRIERVADSLFADDLPIGL